MKLKTQQRFFQVDAERIESDSRTVQLSFSSESPVERYFGREILVHDTGSALLDRLNDGAPLLFNHNMDDVIGVVEAAGIGDDRRGHATVRFATTTRAEEVLGMVKDRVLRNVSFMYRILEAEEDDKKGEYRVTRWEPMEISVVSVPADQSVGIGRGFDQEHEVSVRGIPPTSQPAVPATPKEFHMEQKTDADKKTAFQLEEERKLAIANLCKANKLDKRFESLWIEQGTGLNQVADELLKVMQERGNSQPQSAADIGMTDREVSQYSWFRALRVLAAGHGEVEAARREAGFELEASRAVAKKLGRDPAGIFIPFDVQRGNLEQREMKMQRDMTAYPGGKGGYLVSADNMSFVEILRNRAVLMRMGAFNLSGLEGSVTIPRQTGAATVSWQNTESTAVSSTDQSLGQLSMTPKNAIAVTNLSRQLMMQSSPSAEQMIRNDLAAIVGLAVDQAGINGAGGAQPIGIINTAGITTGITGTTLAYAGAVQFQTSVASANALMGVAGGYVTTPTIAGALMSRSRFANTDTPLWDGNVLDGTMAGFRAMSSLQIPAANMLFGEWSQVVVGEWGVLELALNPYQNFNAALFALRAIYSVDILVRYPQAFALSTNMS